jgi:dCMP deaminase
MTVSERWDNYLMGFARHAATMSKDSTQVGAVIVGTGTNEIRSTGYNGPPRGVLDTPERRERPSKYLFACHAEANAIAFAAKNGVALLGCTIYTTHSPCSSCMKSIIQAGITCVVIDDGKTSMPDEEFIAAYEMASESGVRIRKIGEL